MQINDVCTILEHAYTHERDHWHSSGDMNSHDAMMILRWLQDGIELNARWHCWEDVSHANKQQS